ncbi:glutathione S-transferase [Schizopora paradoxa]|uniref:glutathione transferase n=1 Tax=Schizopora paradoxa TaxID=27342 RepID=A0A0H2RYI7_9AGAM|nr:glutathione S-transferase [Schizopora paradoxa]
MVLKLYGSVLATCTQRVLVVAKYLDLEVELIGIDFGKGEHKSPEYLKKQPFGQVPYLFYLQDDDGFGLFESRAIARYLSVVHGGGKLIPKGARENAIFEQAVCIEQANFDPYVNVVAHERFYGPLLHGSTPDEKLASVQQAKLEGKLDAYETILKKYKYLGGDELTLADLFHLPYGVLVASPYQPGAPFLNFEDPKRPNVARWWREVTSLPAWKAVQTEFDIVVYSLKKA